LTLSAQSFFLGVNLTQHTRRLDGVQNLIAPELDCSAWTVDDGGPEDENKEPDKVTGKLPVADSLDFGDTSLTANKCRCQCN